MYFVSLKRNGKLNSMHSLKRNLKIKNDPSPKINRRQKVFLYNSTKVCRSFIPLHEQFIFSWTYFRM